MQPRLGVGVGPDVVRRKVVHFVLVQHFHQLFHLAEVGEGDGLALGGFLQEPGQGGLVLGLEQVFPLVLVGGVEHKLRVDYPEVLPLFMYASLAQQEHLLALGQGAHGHRPLFQGHLTAIRQHLSSPVVRFSIAGLPQCYHPGGARLNPRRAKDTTAEAQSSPRIRRRLSPNSAFSAPRRCNCSAQRACHSATKCSRRRRRARFRVVTRDTSDRGTPFRSANCWATSRTWRGSVQLWRYFLKGWG